MDADQFLKQRTPRARVSRLAPRWPDIKKLHAEGCSLYVIQDFLKENNIETSITNLHLFIKRQLLKENGAVKNETEKPIATIKQAETVENSTPAIEKPTTVEKGKKQEAVLAEQIPESGSQKKGVKYIPPGKLASMMNRDINIDELKNSNDNESEN